MRFLVPFVDVPGGGMLYSTGSSHLLSAILTRVSGRSTLDLARDWLGKPLGFEYPALGPGPSGDLSRRQQHGALATRDLLRFGELYRRGGELDGRRILPEAWVETPGRRAPALCFRAMVTAMAGSCAMWVADAPPLMPVVLAGNTSSWCRHWP